MNKLPLILAALACIISIFTFIQFRSSSQLVYVDINQLLEGYDRTKIVKAKFEDKEKNLNANVDSLMLDWQKELKNYEKEKTTYSKKELELKQQLLSTKQHQLNNYQQAIQKQIKEEDKKVTQTVINDINDYVKEYGKKHHYKIIFGAGGSGNIMYANDGTDLTQKVLEGLNNEFESKSL